TDLVVFGRAAGLKCAADLKPRDKQAELAKGAGDAALARFDRFRHAKGGTPTAQLRTRMQKVMQNNCPIFRTGNVLKEGQVQIRETWKGIADIAVSDRSMIWNSDLVETLEFDNL